jgi:membrane-bound lytic murein transglycosylase D
MLAGITHQKLLQLNPAFKGPSTSVNGQPYKLVLPIENVEQFTENLARSPLNQKINWVHYKVKSGDTLLSISRKFRTNTIDIRKMNHLSRTNLRPGTNLLIPHKGPAGSTDFNSDSDGEVFPESQEMLASNESKRDAAPIVKKIRKVEEIAPAIRSASTSRNYALQPGDTIYMVRSRDTVEKIASRFHVSSKSLRAANQISGNKLKPGKQLLVPTHLKAMARKTQPATKSKKVQPGDTVYMVRRGDTIEKIARKFRTTASAIRITNLIDNSMLSEGESIVIPTHMRG